MEKYLRVGKINIYLRDKDIIIICFYVSDITIEVTVVGFIKPNVYTNCSIMTIALCLTNFDNGNQACKNN